MSAAEPLQAWGDHASAAAPLLVVDRLQKSYRRSRFSREIAFSLTADFRIDAPAVVGVLGPNGSGKTTLFELITGSNLPSAGHVMVGGQDIHRVRYRERDRLAVHYHQSYQVRKIRRTTPSVLLRRAARERPLVHLFDEPQFNTQDGYIGFMLDFFRRLRGENRLVLVCLHPTAAYQLEILKEICERFLFVSDGGVAEYAHFSSLMQQENVRKYLGALAA